MIKIKRLYTQTIELTNGDEKVLAVWAISEGELVPIIVITDKFQTRESMAREWTADKVHQEYLALKKADERLRAEGR